MWRRIALISVTLLGVRCGGSASETPPPLEPDPRAAHAVAGRAPGAERGRVLGRRGKAPTAEDGTDVFGRALELDVQPAPETWGAPKPAASPMPAQPGAPSGSEAPPAVPQPESPLGPEEP